jgi:hypothetical protein
VTGCNKKEEKAALALAQDISSVSISVELGPDGLSTITTAHAPAAGQHAQEQQQEYRIVEPLSRYASWECSKAIQLSMCEHELAVFLRNYQGSSTARILLEMLGTRYAKPGGCSPHDADQLKPLLDKLSAAGEATGQRANQEQEKTATLLHALQAEGHETVNGLPATSDTESADGAAQNT